MECVIDQVIKSMVVLDKYPEALAQLAQLHKIPQDMMVRLACRKNRAEHLAYKRESDGTTVLWRDYAQEQDDGWHRWVDGIADTHNMELRRLDHENDILRDNNRDLTERNDALRAQVRRLEQECYTTHYAKDGLEETMSRLESEIKRARDSEETTQAFVEKARAYLTKARTKAGRAEFAATSAECPRAELHAQSAHALISEALRVLDRA
jgi:chromosome segregation ATPase